MCKLSARMGKDAVNVTPPCNITRVIVEDGRVGIELLEGVQLGRCQAAPLAQRAAALLCTYEPTIVPVNCIVKFT